MLTEDLVCILLYLTSTEYRFSCMAIHSNSGCFFISNNCAETCRSCQSSWDALTIDDDMIQLEKLLYPRTQGGREWCLRQAYKSIFSLVWLWPLPTDQKVDHFMSLRHRPLVSIDIKICSFIFKISCSQVRWDERTDGRTNGQRENIMTPPVSLSWWRNIKRKNSSEPGMLHLHNFISP